VKTAVALAPKALIDSPLRAWLIARCEAVGVALTVENVNEVCDSNEFTEIMRAHANVMMWNVKMPQWWVHQAQQNVLWMDNALISQRRGIFVDHRGLFAESNLSHSRGRAGNWNAAFYAEREFGWQAFQESSENGPLLVCLQRPTDSSVEWGFLPEQKNVNRIEAFLALVKKHVPVDGSRIVIRQHPKERVSQLSAAEFDPLWTWQSEGTFADAVRGARGVITINSTCAHEAVLAGVPVATLGSGTFTKWGVTLECDGRPQKLRSFMTWRANPRRARAYVNQAMTRHFLPYDMHPNDARPQAVEFHSWLQKCC